MSSLNELRNFINHIKHENNKPIKTSRMAVYQKVLKELKPEERKLLLKIIQDKEPSKKYHIACRIKQLTDDIQAGNFKSSRKTGSWHSFCRIMKNIFWGRIGTNKIINSISKSQAFDGKIQNYKAPEAIVYKKGEKVIPRNKNKALGKGGFGEVVYEHGKKKNCAVKKGDIAEYEIGAELDHPNLAKTYQLYTKKYDTDKREKNLFVMEKVQGKNMNYYFGYHGHGPALPNQNVFKLLSQAKDCCGYLFDQNVVWCDVNDGNIFIEDKTKNLKLIDFGFWTKEANPKQRGLNLLFGAMEIAGWLVCNTAQGKQRNEKGQAFLSKVLFPKEFFGEQINYFQIASMGSPVYSELPWVKQTLQKMENMRDEDIKNFVMSYFDHVVHNFQQPL